MLFEHDDDRKLTGDELDEYNAELRAGTIDDRVKVMKGRILSGRLTNRLTIWTVNWSL
jgi:hypothetical protein